MGRRDEKKRHGRNLKYLILRRSALEQMLIDHEFQMLIYPPYPRVAVVGYEYFP
jgi:hypothetical protein